MTSTAPRVFVAVPKEEVSRIAIFGIGTTEAEALADVAKWGDRPANEIWAVLPATKALYEDVRDNGTPRSFYWHTLEFGAIELQCTMDEYDAVEIAEDILKAVGESIDGGSELSGWTGEEAIDAYSEGADWEDEVSVRPSLRKAVAARIDAELAEWRAPVEQPRPMNGLGGYAD